LFEHACSAAARDRTKKVVGISSLAASITTYDIAGHYIYRASKAALNSLWRSLSISVRRHRLQACGA
jgi:NAD(P)-dependent dehydrogenase (short-subunit alcohol dehydrogenase family)